MWKDKPTGIKILWLWTFGTAAILLSTVSRNRVRDMETMMDAAEQQQQQQKQDTASVDSIMIDNSPPSDEFIRED